MIHNQEPCQGCEQCTDPWLHPWGLPLGFHRAPVVPEGIFVVDNSDVYAKSSLEHSELVEMIAELRLINLKRRILHLAGRP